MGLCWDVGESRPPCSLTPLQDRTGDFRIKGAVALAGDSEWEDDRKLPS